MLAEILGVQDKGWQTTAAAKEKETQMAVDFKKKFRSFDFSLANTSGFFFFCDLCEESILPQHWRIKKQS